MPERVSTGGLRARRWILTGSAVVLVAAAAGSGFVLPAPAAPAPAEQSLVLGRSRQVCTVPSPLPTGTTARLGVVVGPGVSGRVTATPLGRNSSLVSIDANGKGDAAATAVTKTTVLQAQGQTGAATAGTVLATASAGADQGISSLPCVTPSTQSWLVGLASDDDHSSEIELTNPDPTQATADLRFYGADGELSTPGSQGLVVAPTSSRTVGLAGLLPRGANGPIAVQVTTDQGRVAALAHLTSRSQDQPAGAAWFAGQDATARQLVIPGVAGGAGRRSLQIANPGVRRAEVTVQVLGADGAFAPAGADTIDVDSQSTATADLDKALQGEPVAVLLRSDQPIAASVAATSSRSKAAADVAIHPAATPIRGTAAAGYAFSASSDGQLVLSNAGSGAAQVQVAAVDSTGRSRLQRTVRVDGRSTARLDLPARTDGSVVLRTDAAQVYAGVVLSQSSGSVAGLAGQPVVSNPAARQSGHAELDPTTGR